MLDGPIMDGRLWLRAFILAAAIYGLAKLTVAIRSVVDRRAERRWLQRDQFHQPPTAGLGTQEQRAAALYGETEQPPQSLSDPRAREWL